MATELTSQQGNPLTRSGSVIRSNPFAALRRMSDEMERMAEGMWGVGRLPVLFRGTEFPGTELDQTWSPSLEVFQRDGQLVVRAELPGLAKDDVKIEISDHTLLITGERKEEKEQRDTGYYACERSYGAFSRSVPLPEGVQGDDATASFKAGVLEVRMAAPTLPEKHGRQIEIKAS